MRLDLLRSGPWLAGWGAAGGQVALWAVVRPVVNGLIVVHPVCPRPCELSTGPTAYGAAVAPWLCRVARSVGAVACGSCCRGC